MKIFAAHGHFEPSPTFAILFSLGVILFLFYGHRLPKLDLRPKEQQKARARVG